MPNSFLSRDQVHAWSEDISHNTDVHAAALPRLIKAQRRLGRFIEENHESMESHTVGVSSYLMGVVARMFELAGGQLKTATWEQVRAAEAKVGAAAGQILPYNEGFVERFRAIEGRAQPHIMDEAIYALFERKPEADEEQVQTTESVKVFFLLWVAVEVLDMNWKPAKTFQGETAYLFVPIAEEN